MCIICVELANGKLTRLEAISNLREMILGEHEIEVFEDLLKEERLRNPVHNIQDGYDIRRTFNGKRKLVIDDCEDDDGYE